MQLTIMASLAAADPLKYAEAIKAAESAGVDRLHLDLEDGNFVPNITFGHKLIRAVRAFTSLPLDVHLMSAVSEGMLGELFDLGLASVAVHFEAVAYPLRALALIRRLGARAGLALNPRTPVADAAYALSSCDYVLLMANEPDTLGERFLASTYDRIAAAKKFFPAEPGEAGREIVVDGDVDADNVQAVVAAGATTVVCGRAVFGSPGIAANVHALKTAGARAF